MVEYSWWDNGTVIEHGRMSIKEVQMHLKNLEYGAKRLLVNTKADHVVYGVKYYDDNGNLNRVHFHFKPMTDDEFDVVARVKNVVVYALHKH